MDEPKAGLLRAARLHRVGFTDAGTYTVRCEACGRTWNRASRAWGHWGARWWACPNGCNAA